MRATRTEMSELKTRLVLAAITVVAMIVISGVNKGDEARGAGRGAGANLLVSSEADGSLQQAPGTAERVIELKARNASWSPDGKRLVFAQGSALYLAEGPGSTARQVYRAVGLVEAPRFRDDGKRIRFTVKDPQGNTTRLWEVSGDGSDAHLIRGE